MNLALVCVFAGSVGAAAGLRPMLTLAVLAWEIALDRIDLGPTSLSLLASPAAPVLFTIATIKELMLDRGAWLNKRQTLLGVCLRFVSGPIAGAVIAVPAGHATMGAACGFVGAILGWLSGTAARREMAATLRSDTLAGLAESIIITVAVAGAFNPG